MFYETYFFLAFWIFKEEKGCSNHGLRRTSIALLATAGMNSHMIAKTTKKTAASIANYIDAGAADYDLKHTVLSAPFHKRISTPDQDDAISPLVSQEFYSTFFSSTTPTSFVSEKWAGRGLKLILPPFFSVYSFYQPSCCQLTSY